MIFIFHLLRLIQILVILQQTLFYLQLQTWGTPPPKQAFGGSYWKYKKAVKEKKILKQKIKKKETKYHKMFEKMMIKMDKIEDYCNILEERIKSKQPFTPPSSIGSPNSPYKSYLEEDSSEKDKIKKNKKEPIWIRID